MAELSDQFGPYIAEGGGGGVGGGGGGEGGGGEKGWTNKNICAIQNVPRLVRYLAVRIWQRKQL